MIWLNGFVSRLAGLLGSEQGNWADRGVVVAIFTRVLTVITLVVHYLGSFKHAI